MYLPKAFGILAGVLSVFANAQPPRADAVISQLKKSYPHVAWESKSVITEDVTCSGQASAVVFGSEKNKVVVAVVPHSFAGKTQIFTFPLGRDTQDGFCALPTRIQTAPLNCDSDSGALDGCRPIKGCQEFTIDDDDCDQFNFYWDASQRKIRWWRD